tara:strand:- start:605 stop:1039 length:435 start_codon:yes stop_codon:yes gene_type:complete
VTQKYSQLLHNVTSTFTLTLEDDIVPPKGSLVKLFNSLYLDHTVGASAGIYRSSDDPDLACCITRYSANRLGMDDLQNYGTLGGLRTGGGYTMWRTEAIRKSFPIKFTRTSDVEVEGWDWYLSRKLVENDYKLLLNTEVICEHV